MGGFGADNLPYGVFSTAGRPPRVGVRFGDGVLDLVEALGDAAFDRPSLNTFLARGRAFWTATRLKVVEALAGGPPLTPLGEVALHLPFEVADYVDFYASEHHAVNLGAMFRPGADPLLPNWRHLPVGYHGRAGTVVVSGTPVVRPRGQFQVPGAGAPVFGPTRKLDVEVEVGFVVGAPSELGRPVDVGAFADHVFGVCLVNDWSARDIQAWEYAPLGPFLGKSFATSVSPWVVPLEALAAARLPVPPQRPEPLPHLRETEPWGLDLRLELEVNGQVLSRPRYRHMYWSPAQMLAHLTSNGASLRTGDLFASGTVSGPGRDQWGSLIELSSNGAAPVELADGSTRVFLRDGDTVTVRGSAPGLSGGRISLGEVVGTVVGAR